MQRYVVIGLVGLISILVLVGCRRKRPEGIATATASSAIPTSSGAGSDDIESRYRRAIEQAAPGAKITRGTEAKSLLVVLPNGTKVTAFYENIERDCGARPESCDEAITNYVDGLVKSSPGPARPRYDLANLRATIKDKAYVDNAAKDPKMPPLLARPLVADLWMVLTDEPPRQGMRAILDKQALKDFALPEADLYSRALSNIEGEFPELAPEPYEPGSPVLIVVDEAAAAWMLVPKRWEFMTKKVKGDLFASIPNAQTILFAGGAQKTHVEGLRKLTEKLESSEPHPVSRTLLRWTHAGWVEAK